MGATITVEILLFISSGEITKQGLVFCIYRPKVGSKLTRNTSNLLTTIPILNHPTQWLLFHQLKYHLVVPTLLQMPVPNPHEAEKLHVE
ncbi:MAG: hypothetical protein WBA77_06875 [Microcoleaceae cyanobacterium]